jgi:hypothetical protein
LALLERDGLVIRQGHQLVVCADELEAPMDTRILDLPIKLEKSGTNARHERRARNRSSHDESRQRIADGQCVLAG